MGAMAAGVAASPGKSICVGQAVGSCHACISMSGFCIYSSNSMRFQHMHNAIDSTL